MKLLIEQKPIKTWREALDAAGDNETGGILFGKPHGKDDCLLFEATVHSDSGRPFHFVRDDGQARQDYLSLQKKHRRKGCFYLGEWHSHPNSSLQPSEEDLRTMRNLLRDSRSREHCLLLLINRITAEGVLEVSVKEICNDGSVTPCRSRYNDSDGDKSERSRLHFL